MSTFTKQDVEMLIRVVPILQVFARQNPDVIEYDHAHAAYYHCADLARRIQEHIALAGPEGVDPSTERFKGAVHHRVSQGPVPEE